MKIQFESPEEYDALCGMMMSSLRYWKKRRQEAQGKIVMSLDDRGRLCASHYTEEEIAHELESVSRMIDIVNNMPHQEYDWNDEGYDRIVINVEGDYGTWTDPEDDEETDEEVTTEDEEVNEGKLLLNPRPDLSADMIEWMNRPAYAEGRWNQGYRDDPDFHFGSDYESGINYKDS